MPFCWFCHEIAQIIGIIQFFLLLLLLLFVLSGALSRDFTINLSPQCRAFSMVLKNEKVESLAILRPVGAGTTNDWCIAFSHCSSCRT